MPLVQIITLSIIQGITEFLPVSSSGHLVLTPFLLGWKDQGLRLDVAVHIGTLGAVIIYLRQDIFVILRGLFKLTRGQNDYGTRLAGYIVIASAPVFSAGLVLTMLQPGGLRNPEVIGWAFIIFGVLLYLGDKWGGHIKTLRDMSWSYAFAIGFFQIFSLIPGASRSGSTITMARLLGFGRQEAARFSMLLSIPTIFGAGVLLGFDLQDSKETFFNLSNVLAALIAFITALLSIHAMMAWLSNRSYAPFVFYRILIGFLILYLAS
ncbi:MAG: undecaprenyl-diphosphate phosphatase [Rhodospirillaceae bacterium]